MRDFKAVCFIGHRGAQHLSCNNPVFLSLSLSTLALPWLQKSSYCYWVLI